MTSTAEPAVPSPVSPSNAVTGPGTVPLAEAVTIPLAVAVSQSEAVTVALPEAVSSVEYFIDCPTGTVEHFFADDSYRWSDELYRIYGYERGEIVPTLKLGMSHVHPDDQDAVRAFWSKVTTTGGPSSVYASLLDLAGHTRKLLISADLIHDEQQQAVGVWALVVDLTRSIHADTHRLANESVAASALSRAVIEQAKGILMGRAGLDATEAFARISSHSQRTNRKVVVVSQEIVDRTQILTQQSLHRLTDQARDQALLDLFHTP